MQALGMIETYGLIAAVEATDASLKAANVIFEGKKYVGGGIVTIHVSGDVGAVQAAVSAGAAAANLKGEVLACHVIPRLAPGIEDILIKDSGSPKPSPRKTPPTSIVKPPTQDPIEKAPEIVETSIQNSMEEAPEIVEIKHEIHTEENISEINEDSSNKNTTDKSSNTPKSGKKKKKRDH